MQTVVVAEPSRTRSSQEVAQIVPRTRSDRSRSRGRGLGGWLRADIQRALIRARCRDSFLCFLFLIKRL
jgi:hypothetical protein